MLQYCFNVLEVTFATYRHLLLWEKSECFDILALSYPGCPEILAANSVVVQLGNDVCLW